jgi:two-component sensor histidine kinase
MFKLSITLIFLFFSNLALGQGYSYEELSEIEWKSWWTRDHDKLSDVYYVLFDGYEDIDSIKSDKYLRKYYQQALSNRDTLRQGVYFFRLAAKDFYRMNFESAIKTAKISQQLTKRRDDYYYFEAKFIEMRCLYFLNRFQEAKSIGDELLVSDPLLKDFPFQNAKTFLHTGIASRHLSIDSTENYFKRALPIFKENKYDHLLAQLYFNLSDEMEKRDQLDSAFSIAFKAFELSKDSLSHYNLDFMLPAYQYMDLLRKRGEMDQLNEVSDFIQKQRYFTKVSAIESPHISQRASYLEYLQNEQKRRFIIVASIFVPLLILSLVFFIYNKRLSQKKKELKASIALNNVFLKETHHRVKNNYQLMMSMLVLESTKKNQRLNQFVEQFSAKISSMSKVHDLVLDGENKDSIQAPLFFKEVIDTLESSLSLHQKKIKIELIADEIELGRTQLSTLGLIINELVINSVKYAFKENGGKISISLSLLDSGFMMIYQDDGKGLSEVSDSNSLGLSIINSLTKQINGKSEIIFGDGFYMKFQFNPKKG